MATRTEQIKFAVSNNGKIATQALMLLWQNQTPIERRIGISLENNFVGFDAMDDSFMSECAETIECDVELNTKQIARLKRTLPKYANQLARIEAFGVEFPIK